MPPRKIVHIDMDAFYASVEHYLAGLRALDANADDVKPLLEFSRS